MILRLGEMHGACAFSPCPLLGDAPETRPAQTHQSAERDELDDKDGLYEGCYW